jgi:tRNA (cmo5U34)-methyltransferase
MDNSPDTNAALWQSEGVVQAWAADAAQREWNRAAQMRFMALLLPFEKQEAFTFLDLGAGTGAAARAVLETYPGSTAILADFSAAMMTAGEREMAPFAGRYRYVEFDLAAGVWPGEIPAALDAVVAAMSVHHLPDERKQGLFAEILGRLVPGGWYLNYDPVRGADPVAEAAWERVNDREKPEAAAKRLSRTPEEQARFENHIRHIAPLAPQLEYLRAAGFEGIDVYWKNLENVLFGGRRPA